MALHSMWHSQMEHSPCCTWNHTFWWCQDALNTEYNSKVRASNPIDQQVLSHSNQEAVVQNVMNILSVNVMSKKLL